MSYCWHHHQVTGENPLDFTEMVKHTLGEARYERLTRLAWTPIKYGKAEKEELYQHLKSEVARLEQLRLDGVVGRIEVVGYE
jgi:RNA-binding protein YlmH